MGEKEDFFGVEIRVMISQQNVYQHTKFSDSLLRLKVLLLFLTRFIQELKLWSSIDLSINIRWVSEKIFFVSIHAICKIKVSQNNTQKSSILSKHERITICRWIVCNCIWFFSIFCAKTKREHTSGCVLKLFFTLSACRGRFVSWINCGHLQRHFFRYKIKIWGAIIQEGKVIELNERRDTESKKEKRDVT